MEVGKEGDCYTYRTVTTRMSVCVKGAAGGGGGLCEGCMHGGVCVRGVCIYVSLCVCVCMHACVHT